MNDFDILIVGAGPAGISTWLHLNMHAPQLAAHTLVIDKSVFPREKLCAGGLGAWTSDLLRHLDIQLHIPSFFISDIEVKFGKETDLLHHPDCLKMVERRHFDHALVKTAVNRGIELHEDEMLVGITRVKDSFIVKTSINEYRVKVLVGADGALSLVRRKTMPFQKRSLAPTLQVFDVLKHNCEKEFNGHKIVLNLEPINEGLQGYIWHVPCLRDGILSMAHGICDFRIYSQKPRADMKGIFIRELRSWGICPDSRLWHTHPIPWLSDEAIISQPNVLLTGDAAGIEPAFGGGIHMALSYGEIAAHMIIDSFRNGDFSFENYKMRVKSNLLGRTINESTELALKMYSGVMDPLNEVRDFFNKRRFFPDLMLSLLFGDSRSHN